VKLLFLSKYPPIQGGIAAKTYWLSQGLVRKGYNIHIISDASFCDPEYLIAGGIPPTQRGLLIHQVDKAIPWHIPESNHRDQLLLDKALNVIEEYRIDVIDAGYLIPYGIVAYLVHSITGTPYIVRHGGSDLEKFLKAGLLDQLLSKTLSNAAAIITEKVLQEFFGKYNPRVFVQPAYVPDEKAFATPEKVIRPKPVLAYIGKINFYWRHKSLDAIPEIIKNIGQNAKCRFICQGKGCEDFRDYAEKAGADVSWESFVPPWAMPRLLSEIDAIFIFEKRLPYITTCNLRLEAVASNTGIITDEAWCTSGGSNECTMASISDSKAAASMIYNWLTHRPPHSGNEVTSNFDTYIRENEEVYRLVVQKAC
jgi:glycosyltransferase involved in cell wall biosynthesis